MNDTQILDAIAAYLNERNDNVLVASLDGHGSSPSDLDRIFVRQVTSVLGVREKHD